MRRKSQVLLFAQPYMYISGCLLNIVQRGFCLVNLDQTWATREWAPVATRSESSGHHEEQTIIFFFPAVCWFKKILYYFCTSKKYMNISNSNKDNNDNKKRAKKQYSHNTILLYVLFVIDPSDSFRKPKVKSYLHGPTEVTDHFRQSWNEHFSECSILQSPHDAASCSSYTWSLGQQIQGNLIHDPFS